MAELGKEHRRQRAIPRTVSARRCSPPAAPGSPSASTWFIGQFHGVIRPTTPIGSSAIRSFGRMGAKRADPFDMVKGGEEVLQVPGQACGLVVARHVDGRAHFQADGMGHLFLARVVLLQDAFDHGARRSAGGVAAQAGKAALAAATAASVSASLAKRDHRAGLFGRGVDDRAVARRRRGRPSAR